MNFDLTGVIKIIDPVEEPVLEEPVDTADLVEPDDSSPVEETVLEEPVNTVVEESVDSSPVEEPVNTVLEETVVEETVDTDVVEEPVDSSPVEESVVEESVDTDVVEEPVDTVVEEPVDSDVLEEPVLEEPVNTVVEETVDTVVEEPVDSAPVEEPVDSAPVEETVDSSPVEESVDNIVLEEILITNTVIPKLVFIVPYRDRQIQLDFFKSHMGNVLENMDSAEYKIIYVHQKDMRTFNRGAMKNIGFLYVKNLYPNDYKNITLVFNDVDTVPKLTTVLNYQTTKGIVKHFYGYKFTLGGIVSITGGDFEITNGFPNYWAWGYEDNAFQHRVLRSGLSIDRRHFYNVLDSHIIQFNDTLDRVMNRKEFDRYWDEHKYAKVNDGYSKIQQLQYEPNGDFINVLDFKTAVEDSPETNQLHSLTNGSTPFRVPLGGRRRGRMSMIL